MKIGYEHAIILQQYENLLLTASTVFGKGNKGSPRIDENTVVAETGDDIENALRIIGWT